jgi:hypothetical protein
LRDKPDVLRNIRVCRAGPLAIYNFVIVIRILNVCGCHAEL